MTYMELISQVELVEISVSSLSYRRLVPQSADMDPGSLKPEFTVNTKQRKGLLLSDAVFSVQGLSASRDKKHFTFRLRITAIYKLNMQAEVPDDIAEQFSSNNVLFNVWPYFRLELQEATHKMGLPRATAPVLRRL